VKKRIVTGLCLLGLGVFFVANGGLPLYIFVFMVGIACAYELVLMSKPKLNLVEKLVGTTAVALIMFSLFPLVINNSMAGNVLNFWLSTPVKACVLLLIGFYLLEVFLRKYFVLDNSLFLMFRIIVFVVGTVPFIFLIRQGDNGFLNMLFCCVLIWVADISALFGGMKWGKHKLTKLSPKKTIEGSLVALIADLLCAFVFIWCFNLNFLLYSALAIVISILAQLGDLHESLTKRYFNIKDSSGILPGHGGIYDRADSSLFVMPLMFYFFNG
jgi:phosphatidate cytidylyltransferase